MLLSGCYAIWHSSFETSAKEAEAHASPYQRYDAHLDDNFTPNDILYTND